MGGVSAGVLCLQSGAVFPDRGLQCQHECALSAGHSESGVAGWTVPSHGHHIRGLHHYSELYHTGGLHHYSELDIQCVSHWGSASL